MDPPAPATWVVAGNGRGVNRRSRLALATTDSDDSAIAAAAMIGLRVIPNAG